MPLEGRTGEITGTAQTSTRDRHADQAELVRIVSQTHAPSP
jgi:hypothetical protein